MSPNDTVVTDLLASFYGERRTWSLPERAASKALIDHHGWTPARASYVADWLETAPEGRFWRQALTARDGICAVLRNVELITEKSNADKHAAPWPAQAYTPQPKTAEDMELLEQLAATNADKRAAAYAPWQELVDEAQSNGLKGAALFDWVMDQRAERTGRPRADYPTSRRFVPAAKPAPSVDAPRHWQESHEAREGGEE